MEPEVPATIPEPEPAPAPDQAVEANQEPEVKEVMAVSETETAPPEVPAPEVASEAEALTQPETEVAEAAVQESGAEPESVAADHEPEVAPGETSTLIVPEPILADQQPLLIQEHRPEVETRSRTRPTETSDETGSLDFSRPSRRLVQLDTDLDWKPSDRLTSSTSTSSSMMAPRSSFTGRGEVAAPDPIVVRMKTMEELISSITITAREVLGPIKNRRTVREVVKEAKVRYEY